jgi:putative ubiquitin-RnfH superfamily antitoxin RatB of RatAB toxin-antitoxin module
MPVLAGARLSEHRLRYKIGMAYQIAGQLLIGTPDEIAADFTKAGIHRMAVTLLDFLSDPDRVTYQRLIQVSTDPKRIRKRRTRRPPGATG